MIPEPYYINLGGGLQAVHRFFLGNGGKNVSRETYQLTIDNGQLTICPETVYVSLGRTERDKTVRPARGGPRGILIMECIYRSMQKQTVKKFAEGRGAGCTGAGLADRDSLVCLACGHILRTPAIKLPVPCEAGKPRP